MKDRDRGAKRSSVIWRSNVSYGSTAAERTADAVAKANEDEPARAERDGHQTGWQTSG